jgi:hypothetical protein
MEHYQAVLKRHLARYATRRLGVRETGVYQGRSYPHILPYRLRFLNILEDIRAELQDYLRTNHSVKLHRYFHHLNSSQALAFNLFFPFFGLGLGRGRPMTDALGLGADAVDAVFEFVPDVSEGTNVDVAWRSADGGWVFCEVKLSEQEYGSARSDSRHQRKRTKIYLPRLQGLVDPSLLVEKPFFKHYQLLRNISLLGADARNQVVLLLPRENAALQPALAHVLPRLNKSVSPRVRVVYLESVLEQLATNEIAQTRLPGHIEGMVEKYVVSSSSAG